MRNMRLHVIGECGRIARMKRADIALTIRGTPDWSIWLIDFSIYLNLDMTQVVDLALHNLAVEHGFPEPPERTVICPRRIPKRLYTAHDDPVSRHEPRSAQG